ncbi:MAG: polysaccharide deacetylase family protein [Bacteroidota bacterium]
MSPGFYFIRTVYSIRPNRLMRLVYSRALWRIKTAEKKIYLSFDDGPHPRVTAYVLDLLSQYRAKATFFCVGDNIRKYPETYQRVLAEGHSAGNHTYGHFNGWSTSASEYLRNAERCDQIMSLHQAATQTSQASHGKPLFRPPYGKMKRSQYRALLQRYSVVMWDVLSADFDQRISGKECLRNVAEYAREGSIVVFHDSEKAKRNLEQALPGVLDAFSKRGFTFERL